METAKSTEFKIEQFLELALKDFPAIDRDNADQTKDDTVRTIGKRLREEKLAGQNTLSKLTEERLRSLNLPLGYAIAIAEATKNFQKGTQKKTII
jgi:hypothetical protein